MRDPLDNGRTAEMFPEWSQAHEDAYLFLKKAESSGRFGPQTQEPTAMNHLRSEKPYNQYSHAMQDLIVRVLIGKIQKPVWPTKEESNGHKTAPVTPTTPEANTPKADATTAKREGESEQASEPVKTAPTQTPFENIAVPLAARGIPLTPVRPGTKRAFLPDFPTTATTDLEQIKKWAALYSDHNAACVARAEEGGVWFFEVDSKDVLPRITKDTGHDLLVEVPTFRVRSRPGRGHFYFRHNAASMQLGNISQTYVIGQDWSVRTNREYVVAPGSTHPDTGEPYAIVNDTEIAVAPQWLIDWLLSQKVQKQSKPTAAGGDVPGTFGKVPHGAIHGFITHHAGKLRAQGLSQAVIESALLELVHGNCEPPIDDDKVRATVKSICNYEKGVPGYPVPLGQQAQQAPPVEIEWVEPRQLENKLTPVLPFLPEYLPLSMRLWCQDVAERMSLPLDFTGIAALVCASGAVGRRAFVYPKQFDKGWKESIALSGALVADSGKKKTPVWKEMMNPLVELEYEWREQYAKDLKAYKTLYKQWEKAVKTNPQEPEPEKPVCRRSVFTDCTPEALHAAMEENPSGVLYFRDELASWVEELEQDGRQSQRGIFLCGMNGNDPYPLDRIGRGSVYATMCICVGGNFQPELLRRFLSDARNVEDGLVQRFAMLVWPNEVKLPRVDKIESFNKAEYRNVIRGLARLQYDKYEKKPPVELHFDAEAQKLYDAWDVQREERMGLVRGGRKSSLSKYSGMMPKTAALFQLADLAATGTPLNKEPAPYPYYIDAHHTKMAMSFFQYLESHLNRVHSSAFETWQTVEFIIAKKLTEGEMPDGMTARDITRKWNATRTMRIDEIEMALENLAEHGWVRAASIKPDGPGRPSKVWFVNPLAKGKEVYKAAVIAPAAPVDLEPPKKPVVAVKVVDLGATNWDDPQAARDDAF
jgi:hypothetical protein